MLARYRVGDRISDTDALDLAALLERHDEFTQKVGGGVDHFSVMMTEHGTPCFRIERKDGTGTDFSYRHCYRPPLTFEVIVTTFLVNRGLTVDGVPITTGQNEQVAPDITDPQLGEEFRHYHA